MIMSSLPSRFMQASAGGPFLVLSSRLLTVPAAEDQPHGSRLKPFSAMPGPRPLPVIGNTREMLVNRNTLHLYLEQCFEKYGDIFKLKQFGSEKMVVTRDPASIEYVLRAEGRYPVRDTMMTNNFAWLYRNRAKQEPAFVLENGERWKRLRTAVGKQSTPRNVQLYYPAFNRIIGRFVDYIRSTRSEDGVIPDIVEPFKCLFIEMSSQFIYQSDMRVVTNPTEEAKEFTEAIDVYTSLFYRLLAEIPFFKLYNNKLSKEFTKAAKTMSSYAKKEADKVFSRLQSGEESETPGLLEQWLREGKLSEQEAIAESVSMFAAGVDTSSHQTAFMLYLLAKHPEEQEKLYREIMSVFGEVEEATPQQFSQMPYMKGCMLETFRLMTAVPVFARYILEDTYLQGYKVPANTTVMFSLYSVGRDERLFLDPLKFDPERWKRDETHAFAIQPFGYGPRGCYGRRFAELEMKMLLTQFVRNFKMKTLTDDEVEVEYKTVIKPVKDLPIKFIERF